MPRIAGIRTNELHSLLLRMGFIVDRQNDHWRFYHPRLGLRTRISFGSREIPSAQMGRIVTAQLRMSADEFRAAMDGDIPERFTSSDSLI